jgi:hypothetical protein
MTIFFRNGDNCLIIYNGFKDNLDEIKQILHEDKLTSINVDTSDDISCLNYENNSIKKIVYSYTLHNGVFSNINKVDLSNLPECLEILDLSKTNLKFENLSNLPINLKFLSLNIYDDYELSYLPENLKELEISVDSYDTNLDNLPNGLEKMVINGYYMGELSNLPRKLKILHLIDYTQIKALKNTYDKPILNLPPNLNELKIPIEYKYLKNIFMSNVNIQYSNNSINLKKIIIGNINSDHWLFNHRLKQISSFDLKLLPDTIEVLEFGDEFNQEITYLPKNLKKIKFGPYFNRKILPEILPNGIEELEFGYYYNQTIPKYPSNLKILKFGRNFSCNLINLPDDLISLEIGEKFNTKLNLPSKLEILKFNENCEFQLLEGKLELPDSIRILELPKQYNYKLKLKLKSIPKSLELIKFSKYDEKILKLLDESNYQGNIEYY